MDWRICRTLLHMQRNIAEPLRMTSLAERVNLSVSRFSHLFRQETGRTPARYLHDLRLDMALLLLQDTALSIKEVRAAVGLNDPSHFTRDFTERHALPPSEIRNGQRAAPADAQSSSTIGQQTARSANADDASPAAALLHRRWAR